MLLRISGVLHLAIFWFLIAGAALIQMPTAAISGYVRDRSGAVIPQAGGPRHRRTD